MFDKENLTDDDYRRFYHMTCGVYQSMKEIMEEDKEKLIEAQNNYKECQIDFYKNEIKALKNNIAKRSIEIERLEFIYKSFISR
jgi:uncharacterized membrane-anchored protein